MLSCVIQPPLGPSLLDDPAGDAGTMHDLRNMLAVISSGASLVRRDLAGAQAATILDAIHDAAHSAERLASRLTSRAAASRARSIDPGEALVRIAALARARLAERIWLSVRIGPDLPAIVADPERFESAVLNLVLNAEDAMPDGGRLLIRARRERSSLSVTVADTGIGMDAAVQRQAGTLFFTTKREKGSGLGLHQVRLFAASAGGSLSVRSMPGRGTVFALRVPCAGGVKAAA